MVSFDVSFTRVKCFSFVGLRITFVNIWYTRRLVFLGFFCDRPYEWKSIEGAVARNWKIGRESTVIIFALAQLCFLLLGPFWVTVTSVMFRIWKSLMKLVLFQLLYIWKGHVISTAVVTKTNRRTRQLSRYGTCHSSYLPFRSMERKHIYSIFELKHQSELILLTPKLIGFLS